MIILAILFSIIKSFHYHHPLPLSPPNIVITQDSFALWQGWWGWWGGIQWGLGHLAWILGPTCEMVVGFMSLRGGAFNGTWVIWPRSLAHLHSG